MNFKIIVATDKKLGIGFKNQLPWNFKSDMNYFKSMTKGDENNAVVMGKNTYKSIGKALPGRDNLILSTTLNKEKDIHVFSSINDICEYCNTKQYDSIWVIGGESIYKQFLDLQLINIIFVTEIDNTYECDTFFPNVFDNFFLSKNMYESEENNIKLTFKKYYKNIT
jgi:dihydrofolate reductase